MEVLTLKKKRKIAKVYNKNNYFNSLYLRFEVKDKPGVLAQITKQLAAKKISVERLIQIPDNKKIANAICSKIENFNIISSYLLLLISSVSFGTISSKSPITA